MSRRPAWLLQREARCTPAELECREPLRPGAGRLAPARGLRHHRIPVVQGVRLSESHLGGAGHRSSELMDSVGAAPSRRLGLVRSRPASAPAKSPESAWAQRPGVPLCLCLAWNRRRGMQAAAWTGYHHWPPAAATNRQAGRPAALPGPRPGRRRQSAAWAFAGTGLPHEGSETSGLPWLGLAGADPRYELENCDYPIGYGQTDRSAPAWRASSDLLPPAQQRRWGSLVSGW